MEIREYQDLIQHLMKMNKDGDTYWSFEEILDHKKCKQRNSGGWQLLIRWSNGEETWQTLNSIRSDSPLDVAKYARDHQLLDIKEFKWCNKILKRERRYVCLSKLRKGDGKRFKFGIKIPKTVEEALAIDKENSNTLWQDAIKKEIEALLQYEVFDFLDPNEKIPADYQFIPLLMKFDIKMDLRRKARLVAGGHVTKDIEGDNYSGVVKMDSVRLTFLLADLNKMDLLMADVSNAYLNAYTSEKIYTRCGQEFGINLQGKLAIIKKSLYGLKSSAASWHRTMNNYLWSIGFKPSKGDSDLWYRDEGTYYEYICVYVDDLLVASHRAKEIMDEIQKTFKLKGVEEPKTYLGSNIKWITDENGNKIRNLSSAQYTKDVIARLEDEIFKEKFKTKRIETPLVTGDHPELDQSPLLDAKGTQQFQTLMGVANWLIQIGRIDIMNAITQLSTYQVLPRAGHLDRAKRLFGYLKSHPNSAIAFDTEYVDYSDMTKIEYDWHEQYADAEELVPTDAPQPKGHQVQMSCFVDASHADDVLNRRSTTGFIIFLNKTPIIWYSKRQNCIETSTYGSEFTALRIATEHIVALRYKLRTLGVPLQGPTMTFCDNNSVVLSSTIPGSVLKKKHNAIAYHKIRESIACKILQLYHVTTEWNLADILTKTVPGPKFKRILKCILH